MEKKLRELIASLLPEGVIVAFSGGVDSSLILKIAKEEEEKNGGRLLACFFESRLSPRQESYEVEKIADQIGVDLVKKTIDQTKDENVMMNRVDRCYHCKKALFSEAKKIGQEEGYKYIVDGTNLSDMEVYRPGLKALSELGIISPLREAGFYKKDVRDLAKKEGLSVSSKPSAPCLATRFPYDQELPLEKFPILEEGEDYLKDLGFPENRIRLYGEVTRIEVPKKDLETLFSKRDQVVKKFKDLGFKYVNIDLEGYRSGSMDEVL